MTWEQDMADKAKVRRQAKEAEYLERCEQVGYGPPGHEGHHEHLIGTSVVCSCGEFRGVTCVAFAGAIQVGMVSQFGLVDYEDYHHTIASCDKCKRRGLWGLG